MGVAGVALWRLHHSVGIPGFSLLLVSSFLFTTFFSFLSLFFFAGHLGRRRLEGFSLLCLC